MGQQQSKDELLYQQVSSGNAEAIKTLRSQGAGLEWIDSEGKTPLIAACMSPELHNVAKTLIELGANVNAYRPGRNAGTPLHHAAKRGLEQTVKLLLSHRANALMMNDECQTPLDVARVKGYSNVVRAIERHICLFSGWLRELYGPGFLELLAPQLLSRKVWVVVLPCGSRSPRKPVKLELAIYTNAQDAQPRTIVALWKANMEEPNFSQHDPVVIISNTSTIPKRWRRKRGIMNAQVARKTRIKIAAASEIEKQQLQWFCNACKGIPQVVRPSYPFNAQVPVVPVPAPPTSEDMELAMAIDASIQSVVEPRPPPHLDTHQRFGSNALTSQTNSVSVTMNSSNNVPRAASPKKGETSTCEVREPILTGEVAQHIPTQSGSSVVQTALEGLVGDSIPSAPPVVDAVIDDGPIHYPEIDATHLDVSSTPVHELDARAPEGKDTATSSSCVICLDAPVEGACIPCGHMAGCMSCLNEIKAKKWGCPVCRAKIDQVVRLYAV